MKTKNPNWKAINQFGKAVLLLFVFFNLPSLYASGNVESSRPEPDYRDPATLQAALESGTGEFLLIDVRTREEFEAGHIPGAVLNPVAEIGSRLPDVPKDFPLVLYCRSGNRSAQAADILKRAGYTSVTDFGGINRWNYPLARP